MRKAMLTAAAIVACALAIPAAAATSYSVTDLGDLPGGQDYSSGSGINASGQIAGSSVAFSGGAFLWTPTTSNGTTGSLTNLGDLPGGGDLSYGHGINDSGAVVGRSRISSTRDHAFLWQPTTPNATAGSMIDLGDLPGGADSSSGSGINAIGQVVGQSGASTGDRAFLWTPTAPNATAGSMTDLGDLPNGGGSHAFGINTSGQVVGWSYASAGNHAFLWTPITSNATTGSMTNLGDLPGGSDFSEAFGINAFGQVVGRSGASTGEHAFLWTPNTANATTGSMIDLGDLPGGSDYSYGWAINGAGQVVGWSYNTAGPRAFVWTSEDGMMDLNAHLDASGAGWTLLFAHGINDSGQIVGAGTIGGVTHGFLLTPIPEPAALALCMLASLVALLQRR